MRPNHKIKSFCVIQLLHILFTDEAIFTSEWINKLQVKFMAKRKLSRTCRN